MVPALDVLSVSVLRLLKLRKVVMEETMRKKSKSKKGFYQVIMNQNLIQSNLKIIINLIMTYVLLDSQTSLFSVSFFFLLFSSIYLCFGIEHWEKCVY